MRVFFFFCKGQVFGAILCRVLILVLNTLDQVMAGPLGFHARKCWLSGIVDCLLMGGSPPSCWAIWALGWCSVLLWVGPFGHMTALIFCFVKVIVRVRVVIPDLAHLILPTWTYCFDRKPLFLVSRLMTPFVE